jgi:hypothetical protein
MGFNADNEYYIVKGWFNQTGGIYEGTFYGAMSTPDDPLQPKRVAVSGEDAAVVSRLALAQSAVVYPQELFESDQGGLNPKERSDTDSMLLDGGDEQLYVHVPTGMKAKYTQDDHTEEWSWRVLGPHYAAGFDLAWYVSKDQDDNNYRPIEAGLDESLSTGAIAIKPAALSPNNVARLGMPDRGGHGRVDNLGPKRVKTGRNMVKPAAKSAGKKALKGIGNSVTMRTISQSGGRKGGR